MPAHKHILMTISSIDINKISNDDPLCIGIIDISSEKYNIPDSQYEARVVCIPLFFFLDELATKITFSCINYFLYL